MINFWDLVLLTYCYMVFYGFFYDTVILPLEYHERFVDPVSQIFCFFKKEANDFFAHTFLLLAARVTYFCYLLSLVAFYIAVSELIKTVILLCKFKNELN